MLLVSYLLYTLFSIANGTPIVTISSGPIQGQSVKYNGTQVYQFLGIPYAKPPVESLRLQAPEKVDSWSETKLTVNVGASCPQRNQHIKPESTSEDCLFLNVYVKESTFKSADLHKRPVLFWIHGGALTMGSGDEFYPGVPMVPLNDVILVTHNYRLNALGFIYFGPDEKRIPSNLGLRDQLLALQWVKENIASFGGDPDQVTIFGESAGSMSVSAHLLSPLSKGLFQRAILESGSIYNPVDDPSFFIRNAWSVYNRTSCASNTEDILGCLQSLQVSEIIASQSDGILRFRWTFGDDFLPFTPTEAFSQGLFDDSVDLLIGTEKNEFSIFMAAIDPKLFNPITPAPIDYQTTLGYLSLVFKPEALDYYRELYLGPPTIDSNVLRSGLERAYSDTVLLCPTYIFGLEFGSRNDEQSGKVFAYYHTQKATTTMFVACDASPWMGTCHAGEVPFVFGSPLIDQRAIKDDITLSLEMMNIWTHFAEFGKPPSVGGTEWKTLAEDESAMILNVAELGKVDRERIDFCKKQWNNFTAHGSLQLLYLIGAA